MGVQKSYSMASLSDDQKFSNDSHAILSFGSEEMLVDIGTSGSSSVRTTAGHTDWNHAIDKSAGIDSITKYMALREEKSTSEYNFGTVLGGDSEIAPPNEFSYDISITAAKETHGTHNGEHSGYITTEI
ncbi:MAG: hypothetical protein Fues2KO_05450 [Fuerstiella sp.]